MTKSCKKPSSNSSARLCVSYKRFSRGRNKSHSRRRLLFGDVVKQIVQPCPSSHATTTGADTTALLPATCADIAACDDVGVVETSVVADSAILDASGDASRPGNPDNVCWDDMDNHVINKQLKAKAKKTRLTTRNVKLMIKNIISNEQMVAVMQQFVASEEAAATGDDDGATSAADNSTDPSNAASLTKNTSTAAMSPPSLQVPASICQPPMTRARAQRLRQQNQQLQILPLHLSTKGVCLSPVKNQHPTVTTDSDSEDEDDVADAADVNDGSSRPRSRLDWSPTSAAIQLIAGELGDSSDNDDEEYRPGTAATAAGYNASEADASSRASSPTFCWSPRSVASSSFLPDTPLTCGELDIETPGTPSADLPPAARTRSRQPLKDRPLELLEQMLVAPDVTPDMYTPVVDDEDWSEFMRNFNMPMSENTADDDEDDEEYVFQMDEEELEREELRLDPASRISRKEVNQLINELFKDVAELQQPNSSNNCFPLLDKNDQSVLRSSDVIPSCPSPSSSTPLQLSSGSHETEAKTRSSQQRQQRSIVTPDQANQLRVQVAQHTQLLVQTFALSVQCEWGSAVSLSCKTLLVEMHSLARAMCPDRPEQSFFAAANLWPALELLAATDTLQKRGDLPAIDEAKNCYTRDGHTLGRFSEWLTNSLLDSASCVFPDMLPLCVPRPYNRLYVTCSVDQLIAMGLEQFRPLAIRLDRNLRRFPAPIVACELIVKHMLPVYAPLTVRNRVMGVRYYKLTDSPIHHFVTHGRAPVVTAGSDWPDKLRLLQEPLVPLRQRASEASNGSGGGNLPEPWGTMARCGPVVFKLTGVDRLKPIVGMYRRGEERLLKAPVPTSKPRIQPFRRWTRAAACSSARARGVNVSGREARYARRACARRRARAGRFRGSVHTRRDCSRVSDASPEQNADGSCVSQNTVSPSNQPRTTTTIDDYPVEAETTSAHSTAEIQLTVEQGHLVLLIKRGVDGDATTQSAADNQVVRVPLNIPPENIRLLVNVPLLEVRHTTQQSCGSREAEQPQSPSTVTCAPASCITTGRRTGIVAPRVRDPALAPSELESSPETPECVSDAANCHRDPQSDISQSSSVNPGHGPNVVPDLVSSALAPEYVEPQHSHAVVVSSNSSPPVSFTLSAMESSQTQLEGASFSRVSDGVIADDVVNANASIQDQTGVGDCDQFISGSIVENVSAHQSDMSLVMDSDRSLVQARGLSFCTSATFSEALAATSERQGCKDDERSLGSCSSYSISTFGELNLSLEDSDCPDVEMDLISDEVKVPRPNSAHVELHEQATGDGQEDGRTLAITTHADMELEDDGGMEDAGRYTSSERLFVFGHGVATAASNVFDNISSALDVATSEESGAEDLEVATRQENPLSSSGLATHEHSTGEFASERCDDDQERPRAESNRSIPQSSIPNRSIPQSSIPDETHAENTHNDEGTRKHSSGDGRTLNNYETNTITKQKRARKSKCSVSRGSLAASSVKNDGNAESKKIGDVGSSVISDERLLVSVKALCANSARISRTKQWLCPHCNLGYSCKRNVTRHMRQKHGYVKTMTRSISPACTSVADKFIHNSDQDTGGVQADKRVHVKSSHCRLEEDKLDDNETSNGAGHKRAALSPLRVAHDQDNANIECAKKLATNMTQAAGKDDYDAASTWSLQEDRILLAAVQQHGAEAPTFRHLRAELSRHNIRDMRARLKQLLLMLQQTDEDQHPTTTTTTHLQQTDNIQQHPTTITHLQQTDNIQQQQ